MDKITQSIEEAKEQYSQMIDKKALEMLKKQNVKDFEDAKTKGYEFIMNNKPVNLSEVENGSSRLTQEGTLKLVKVVDTQTVKHNLTLVFEKEMLEEDKENDTTQPEPAEEPTTSA